MIDTKLLRQKLLDLAIRGKLVPQDPSDEPASVILQKIRDEKAALVKAGKIKKDKHESFIFRGDDNRYYEQIDGKITDISGEIPFEIPQTWSWGRLKDLSINKDNERIPLSKNEREKIQKIYDYYGASGIIDKVDRFLFKEPLLLVGEDGANLLTRTKPIAFIASGKYWVNNHAHVLQPQRMIDLQYLCFFINSISLEKYVTGSAQPKMTQDNMNTILISLPPLGEQKRIVSRIEALLKYADCIDADTATLERSLSLAKQKILDLAIRGKLVHQDPADEPASELLKKIKAEKEALIKAEKLKRDKHESFIFRGDDNCYYEQIDGKTIDITEEIPFEIPKSWCWCRLGSIVDLLSGRDLSPSSYSDRNGKKPYLTGASNFDRGQLIINRWTDYPEVIAQYGDVLITCKGTIGEIAINTIGNMHIARQIMALRTMSAINKYYLEIFLRSSMKNIKTNANGLIPGISRGVILSLLIPVPSLSEQQCVVQVASKITAIIDSISK